MISTEQRLHVLTSFGADHRQFDELLAYNANHFCIPPLWDPSIPLSDEASCIAWDRYAAEVKRVGSLLALSSFLPQFQFPIQTERRLDLQYLQAVNQGRFIHQTSTANSLRLQDPTQGTLQLVHTLAGRIAAITSATRADFVTLVQAFTCKGEPCSVAGAKGACIIAGFNNFDRIHRLKDEYLRTSPNPSLWPQRWAEIKQQKELYQDSFILLSPGEYSGVPAAAMELSSLEWRTLSLRIRIEHECAHYCTRRLFGSMRNNMLDELLADYCGLEWTIGTYRADWALRFLGINEVSGSGDGGRLENYRGDPPLSEGAMTILRRLVYASAKSIEVFSNSIASRRHQQGSRGAALVALASATLERLAMPDAPAFLLQKFNESLERVSTSI